MNRVILSAVSSGSGKTTITCGLLMELKRRGLSVKSYKCGPDYIDPMFHKKVLKVPSENLDLFFSNAEYIKNILSRDSLHNISVIEGAMGIYDGILGCGMDGSAYDLAVKTKTPIVLIVDAKGIGNTVVSVVKGILSDDINGLVKGIILNRTSEHFFNIIKPVIEEKTGIKVLGYVGKLKDVSIDSRHLGLMLPDEIKELESKLEVVRESLENTVDIDGLIDIACSCEDIENIEDIEKTGNTENLSDLKPADRSDSKRPCLAVAYDEAFCFYYEENLRILEEAGARLVYFSPVNDKRLPENVSGILIGGGYPELKLKELSQNESMRISIKEAYDKGIPMLAECGGFMYLHDEIENEEGSFKMVGAIPGKSFNTGKLTRFGYVDLRIKDYNIKGHEFHYFDSTNNGSDGIAIKPGNKRQWTFGHICSGRILGFPHLYYGSCKKLAYDFVDAMKEFKEKSLNE